MVLKVNKEILKTLVFSAVEAFLFLNAFSWKPEFISKNKCWKQPLTLETFSPAATIVN